jgi:hypothetical protein
MVGTFDRKLPLVTEITLKTILRVLGDNWNEESALVDLVPDFLIPRVPAPQLAPIEKGLDAAGSQCLGNLLGDLRVL